VSLEDDFSATREPVTTPKKKPPISKPKPKARANGDDGDDDGARLGGGELDFEAPTFAANDDDYEADDISLSE
jgi:hypothetical protein